MTLALALATVGAGALAAFLVLAACRAAAFGDTQMAREAPPPAPVDEALAALPRGLQPLAEQVAETLDVDVAAILLAVDVGCSRVAAVAGAPALEGALLTGQERLIAIGRDEHAAVAATAELADGLGALVVARREASRPLGGRDLELLGVLADVVASAIRDPVTPELLDAVAGQVDALAASLGPGRTELRWRGGDFVALVSTVALRLGLDAADRAELELAARLLDVGLLGVPVEMLERRGALRLSELFLVRRHAADGADVLLRVPGMAGVALLVRCHHERWDGRGYPHGLAGERIPRGARVLAACDAWWAMTGPRPYATAVDAEDAIAELRAVAGSQLDPEVVGALLGVLAESVRALA